MPPLSYQQPGLVLERPAAGVDAEQVRDLQRHLRSLGYLRQGIDGDFGPSTERAVMGLQHELLHNNGAGSDADAPVRVLDYNEGRVTTVTGRVDEGLAACISDMLDDPAFSKLPFADAPAQRNQEILSTVAGLGSETVPLPFLLAILMRESNLQHFRVPRGADEDSYIVVGLDRNAGERHIITSRGYGIGQYTLFHHPPRPEEVDEFMGDVRGNVDRAVDELREKFDHFVNGPDSGTQADDRLAEFGTGPLRLCKHPETDPRYMTDCKACAQEAGSQSIEGGVTPWYEGSGRTYQATQYYDFGKLDFSTVPVRRNVGCDWPYATRRYNGSGPNSYNYQALVLKNLLDG